MNYYAGPWDYKANIAFGVEDPMKLGLVRSIVAPQLVAYVLARGVCVPV